MMEKDEQELTRQAIGGDQAAVGQLMLMCEKDLLAFLKKRIPSDLRGQLGDEDVLQQAYVDAFRGIGSFQMRGAGCFQIWMKAIAENRLRDAVRKARRVKRGGRMRRVVEASEQSSSVTGLLGQLAASTNTPSQSAMNHEMLARLTGALEQLKPTYRQAIVSHYIQGISMAEVARCMNLSTRAAQMVRSRALRVLEKLLEEGSQAS